MQQPKIKRSVKFQNPLFDARSPWRQYVGELEKEKKHKEVQAIPESELQGYAVFESLRLGSLVSMTAELASGGSREKFDSLNAQSKTGGHLQVPGFSVQDFSFPIFEAKLPGANDSSEVLVRQYDGDNGFVSDSLPAVNGRVSGLPLPVGKALRPAGPKGIDSDGAVILVDTSDLKNLVAYDYWQATTIDENGKPRTAGQIGKSIIEAGSVARWSLNEKGLGAMVPESRRRLASRASGLPYMGGLFIPEDLERLNLEPGACPGKYAVEHALAFVLPQGRLLQHRFDSPNFPPDYVFPASNLETSYGSANPYALAAGQRIRLKGKYQIRNTDGDYIDEGKLKPITQIFLNTLRDRGAYLVDGGLGFGFAAEDEMTAPLDLDAAQVKYLVGSEEPLPDDVTAWYHVVDQLNADLRTNGMCFGVPEKKSRAFERLHLNFEVTTNPIVPSDIPRGG